MTAADYRRSLMALLPRGLAWPRKLDSMLGRLLAAFADGLARFDVDASALERELDPRTAVQLLPDWEEMLGLPDPCVTEAQSIEQRQRAAYSKLTAEGGASRPFFIGLAADVGYPGAVIETYRPMTCNDDCNHALWTEPDRFSWQINLPSDGGLILMDCNSSCDSSLAVWGYTVIEFRIRQIQPAEFEVIFAYT